MTMRTRSKASRHDSSSFLPKKRSYLEKQYLEDEMRP